MEPTTLGGGEHSSTVAIQEKMKDPSVNYTLDSHIEQQVGCNGLKKPFQLLHFKRSANHPV